MKKVVYEEFSDAISALANREDHCHAAASLLANAKLVDDSASWAFARPMIRVIIAHQADKLFDPGARVGVNLTDALEDLLLEYDIMAYDNFTWESDVAPVGDYDYFEGSGSQAIPSPRPKRQVVKKSSTKTQRRKRTLKAK